MIRRYVGFILSDVAKVLAVPLFVELSEILTKSNTNKIGGNTIKNKTKKKKTKKKKKKQKKKKKHLFVEFSIFDANIFSETMECVAILLLLRRSIGCY